MTIVRAWRAAVAVLVLGLAGCDYMPFGYTGIGEIVKAPAQFEGREVRLQGRVVGLAKLPFLQWKAYTLADDSGEISVLTALDLPAQGETIAMRGTVRSAAIFGAQSIGLRVEETVRLWSPKALISQAPPPEKAR